jgi:osmotically-inducible protein OsmY
MQQLPAALPRHDEDIRQDILAMLRAYQPLQAAKHHLSVNVHEGFVTVRGNVRNPQSRRIIIDNLPTVRGVKEFDVTALYDDESIRFAVGQIIPPGVFASVQYGAVVLTGRLTENASGDLIADTAMNISGVWRVAANFGNGDIKRENMPIATQG